MQGQLIVFEGVEGGGKTTQIQQLYAWLTQEIEGLLPDIQLTCQPGGTELGREIRRLLLNPPGEAPVQDMTELMLYAADRAQHVAGFLRPKLAAGAIVLCDRYTDSTIAYQGYGRGLKMDLIHQLNRIATDGLESDLTIWLDVAVEVGLARTQKRGAIDRIEQADLAFHQRVQQGYRELAATYPERIVRIDASLSTAEVTEQIRNLVKQRLTAWNYPVSALS
ncbi:dTMP kinase [Leptolyngbya sp. 'hensonii']|uniref:dTMP kinase n=1 Tax=Leptolyngbya sp. 'hensonii' TaxID=1922337 RepID=UPI0009502DB9|nr:dTMP kinase [Leptolyngbya sp. 'hensonii']OLP15960.1 dTMP kinase [Leptolyngbya sp. 'hensonii']